MPELMRVLKCTGCKRYRVDKVKKSNKWKCKVCSLTQDVENEFYRGTEAECRNIAMLRNEQRASRFEE